MNYKPKIVIGDCGMIIDLISANVTLDNKVVELSLREYRIVVFLALEPYKKHKIYEIVSHLDLQNEKVAWVTLCRIREKFSGKVIPIDRANGYSLI